MIGELPARRRGRMVSPVRIAHISDLHLLDLEGAVPRRIFNKRFTGWVNIRLNRGHTHKPTPVLSLIHI